MMSHSFQVGEILQVDGATHVIAQILANGQIYQLANRSTAALRNIPKRDLLEGYARGTVSFVDQIAETWAKDGLPTTKKAFRPLASMSDPARRETLRRRTYLKRLDERSALRFDRSGCLEREIGVIAESIGDPRPPHRSTVHRWYRQWVQRRRDVQAVACRFDRRGARGEGRHHDEVEAIIASAVDEIYLTEQRHTAKETWEVIEDRVRKLNRQRDPTQPLPVPGLRTIQRRISMLVRYEVVARREGEAVAKRRFRAAKGVLKVHKILGRVEMDHTPLNLFVVDEENWLPCGRPTLTVALDRASRTLLGYWIGFTGNGVDAVLGCLGHAIRPKTYLATKYPHIKLGWPCFGLPQTLWVDNGMEFAGNDLKVACDDMGIDLFFLPARKPEWKGSVERFLKTFNHSLIHRIPGTTYENISARGDYDAAKHALVSLADLERLIETWVCDVYHNEVHRGLSARPIDVWNRGAEAEEPALPSDIGRLEFQLGESEERKVWHYGVQLHGGQMYNNDDLREVFAALGRVLVRVRYHRRNIGRVWVEHPVSKEFFEVPNVDQEYSRNLTLEQHDFIRGRAKKDANGKVDREALMAAKTYLREQIQQLLMARKLADRRKGKRLAGSNSGELREGDPELLNEYAQQLRAKKSADSGCDNSAAEAGERTVETAALQSQVPLAALSFAVRDAGTGK